MVEQSAEPVQEVGQGQGPNKIEWRSRVDDRPQDLMNDVKPPVKLAWPVTNQFSKINSNLDLASQFSNQYQKDQEVYVNGARGSLGPFKVDEVVGQGKYKLRKDNGEKLKKTYDEGDLSLLPKLV